jgi:Uma2 family endonuclease
MATSPHPQITQTEYLRRSWRPDREFIDGALVERNVGSSEHGRMAALLAGWFGVNEKDWSVVTSMSCGLQVSPTRIRVPDLLLTQRIPQPAVITDPPILVVEILSHEDSWSETQRKAGDYFAMGVNAVWIVDPRRHDASWCSGGIWHPSHTQLEVPGTRIHVDLAPLFAEVDLTRMP